MTKQTMNLSMGILRAVLAAVGGGLCKEGFTDEQSWAQFAGALIILAMAAWSIYSKKELRLPPADKATLFCLLLLGMAMSGCTSMDADKIRDVIQDRTVAPVLDPVIQPVVDPPVVDPQPTPTNALPFDPSVCTFHRIAGDVLEWKETRTLTVTKFTRDKLWSTCPGPEWPEKGGLQGCFGLAVEQPNGEVIVGTWDWNRSKHQTMKLLENLHGAEHSFFKLYSGARIWWFTTAFSRDSKRTVLERTQFVEARWP